MARAAVLTVGCRLNQAESDSIQHSLEEQGYELAERFSSADLCIINTCTVTKEADRTSLNLIRRISKCSPKPEIVVTGCLVVHQRDTIEMIPGIDRLIARAEKDTLTDQCPIRTARSRPFVKIEDGCSNGCSFCIASRIRGRPRSQPPGFITSEVEQLRDQNFGEIVLVGLNLGVYGVDIDGSLAGLLGILQTVRNLPRIRLSSIEPETITPALLSRWDAMPLCRHLHVPLQSGADRILRAMGRNYTVSEYIDRIDAVDKKIPGVALGTDVIVGFPGEDESAFLETKRIVEELPFAYIHVFSYSPRLGTPAYEWGDPVPRAEKHRRSNILREVGARKFLEYRKRFQDRPLEAVLERNGRALTDNYIRVSLSDTGHRYPGSVVPIRISEIEGNITLGEIRR